MSYWSNYYGHYEDVDDIDFNSLPNKFVIKSNNGFGTVKIVKDKTLLDIPKTKIELKSWIAEPYGYLTGEMHYTKDKKMHCNRGTTRTRPPNYHLL